MSKQPIYRYHAVQNNGWRFLYSPYPNLQNGWKLDGVAFLAPVNQPDSVPVKQFYYDQSSTYGGWRMNYNLSNKPATQGWNYNNMSAFKAFNYQKPGTVPVYQYHCAQSDGWRFLFSTNPNQGNGWSLDGVAFYAYPGFL